MVDRRREREMVTKRVQGQMDRFANIGVFSSERGKDYNGAVIVGR
jgi:hypothetical protein